jgi:hypothetical protein
MRTLKYYIGGNSRGESPFTILTKHRRSQTMIIDAYIWWLRTALKEEYQALLHCYWTGSLLFWFLTCDFARNSFYLALSARRVVVDWLHLLARLLRRERGVIVMWRKATWHVLSDRPGPSVIVLHVLHHKSLDDHSSKDRILYNTTGRTVSACYPLARSYQPLINSNAVLDIYII